MDIAFPMASFMNRIEHRLFDLLAEQAEDWCKILPALSKFEDDYLVVDPTPERIAECRAILEQSIRMGKLLQSATEPAEFPNRRVAAMVRATLGGLEDMMAMRYGQKLSAERREKIIAACFPE